MLTQDELNKVVNNYLNALNGKITIQKVILFGSYAKGLAHDYSDIDLLIISDELPKNKLKTSNGYFGDQLTPVSQGFFEEIFRTWVAV